jgi:hypothetical protein
VPDYKRPDGTTVPDYKPRSERLGLLAVYGGLLRHTGKPLALTELGVRRSYGLSAARPEELRHLIYRGLYYRVGWFNLHSWSRKSGDGTASVPHNTFYSLNYSHHSDTLHTLRQVRDELEFIAPHATFGEPLPPPLAILVSRSSNHFPGLGGAFYGDLLYRLGEILDKPEYALYEVVEEHARGLADWLRACRGVVVVDVCLESDTRDLLDELAKGGTRLLAFGAPEYVDARYRPAPFPASYPVIGFTRFVVRHGSAVLRHLHDLTLGGSGTPDPTGLPHVAACPTIGRHPLLSGLPTVTLLHPAGLDGRRGSRFLAHLPGDPHTPVAAVRENVFYLSGLPTAVSEVKTLLRNFAAWCGLSLPEVLVSPFQRAVVVQHYQPQREGYDGTWIDATPWVGQVRLPHRGRQQVRELRTDTPWLAYHYDGDDTVLEGVCLEPWGIRVFRPEEAPELPHFEGLPPTVAGTAFYYDNAHVIARFHVTAPTDVEARFVPGPWADAAVTWFVTPVGSGDHLAQGDPPDLRFSVAADFDGLAGTHRPYRLGTEARPYYLVAVRRDHHTDPRCPLCREGWF